MNDVDRSTGIRLIPPLVFLGFILLGFAVDWLWPAGFGVPAAVRWTVGLILIVGPISVLPSLFTAFRRANSEYDVRKMPNALVTDGAFRYSRNPGYLGLIIVTVGIAVAFDDPWVLLALVPAIALVHYGVVLMEEAVLERAFGDEYREYKRRVRRWI